MAKTASQGHMLRERRRLREVRAAVGWLTPVNPVNEDSDNYRELRGAETTVRTADGGFKVHPDHYVSPGGPGTLVAYFSASGLTLWPEFVWSIAGQIAAAQYEPRWRQQGLNRGVTMNGTPIQWRWATVDDTHGDEKILQEIRATLSARVRR